MAEADSPSEILLRTDSQMRKAVEALGRELASLRTGRATPALVEHLRVDYHGVPTPLQQVASITAPEANLLLIQPWDSGVLKTIERTLLKSDLGLVPSSDGRVIRLAIPALTEERRRELVKMVHKRVEQGRVELRNLRRDALDDIRKLERNKAISADEEKRGQTHLQKLTDGYLEEANRVGQAKETELLEA